MVKIPTWFWFLFFVICLGAGVGANWASSRWLKI